MWFLQLLTHDLEDHVVFDGGTLHLGVLRPACDPPPVVRPLGLVLDQTVGSLRVSLEVRLKQEKQRSDSGQRSRVSSHGHVALVDLVPALVPRDDGLGLGTESLAHQLVLLADANEFRLLHDRDGHRAD